MSTAGPGPDIAQHADAARTSLHAIALLSRETHPVPVVCTVLGDLKGMSRFLPPQFPQLVQSLVKSLERTHAKEDGGTDPAAGLALAGKHLTRAAELAEQMGEELAKAQDALAGQGSQD
jgi:hypothetical protein